MVGEKPMRKQPRPLVVLMGACVVVIVLGFNVQRAAAQITVTSATPNNAQQGTANLNVNVTGSGFASGATTTWYVTGTTETGGVIVNSTTFVNSSQVVANITIPGNATPSGYDIVVKNTSGRTGVGSDQFTVNPEAVTSMVSSTDISGNAATVQNDDLFLNSSGASSYENNPSGCSTYSVSAQKTCEIMSLLPNDWYLRYYSGPIRQIRLTLVALSGSPDESALDGLYPLAVATRCFNASNNWVSIPLTIRAGTSNNRCSLRVNFTANGISYFYVMSPLYAGTGWSTVACTASSLTDSCTAWTITPTPGNLLPNPNLADVANLYIVEKSGQLALVGTYKMTFNIALTQP
jgi:hypothetical protein